MPSGTVKWFNRQRGFGYITPVDGGPDLYVHHTGIEGSGFRVLHAGERVDFEVGSRNGEPRARSVRVVQP